MNNTEYTSDSEITTSASIHEVATDPHGFVKVAAISPRVWPGNPEANIDEIIRMLSLPALRDAGIVVLPELSVTGYSCADLFFQQILLDAAEKGIERIAEFNKGHRRLIVVGAPVAAFGKIYNCAVAIDGGDIPFITAKSHIPNYQEFYEKRWFSPAPESPVSIDYAGRHDICLASRCIYDFRGISVGAEICEDLWVASPPSSDMSRHGAEIIVNLSATNETIGKHAYLLSLISQQSARCRCGYVYASAGQGESSTDLVFAGNAIIAEQGLVMAESRRFMRADNAVTAILDIQKIRADRLKYNSFSDSPITSADKRCIRVPALRKCVMPEVSPGIAARLPLERFVDPTPFVPSDPSHLSENCEEITHIQSWGLEQRLIATGCRRLVVGISGGLDSTLALLIAVMTFRRLGLDTRNIIGITMPGEATTGRTLGNARILMERLGVTSMEIPIGKAVSQHFADIGQDPEVRDAAYENTHARERTQILMDMANKTSAMVLGTGDLSELALGWCTYNGDHMSMYAVNAGVPKTLVKHLVEWFANQTSDDTEACTLRDIIDTPISPELIPAKEGDEIAQKTEELVGPYELHDFFLYHVLRNGFTPSKIFRMARTAFGGKYTDQTLAKWLVSFYRRFFSQQFKRSCMPDGPKVGSVCLSPRGDWRMPSDACPALWIKEAENILHMPTHKDDQ